MCYFVVLLSLAIGMSNLQTRKFAPVGKDKLIAKECLNLAAGVTSPFWWSKSDVPRDTILHTTNYDHQWNAGEMPRRILLDKSVYTYLHIIWMSQLGTTAQRHMHYACNASGVWTTWQQRCDPDANNTRDGYGSIDILPDGREVVALHRKTTGDFVSAVGIEQGTTGEGNFSFEDLPYVAVTGDPNVCLLYTSPSPRD